VNMNRERLTAIDIAKGIGIILVVFTHVNYTPNILTVVYSFHMPLFFVLSGLLFKKEKYTSFLLFFKHRFVKLVVPYIIYEIASIVYLYITNEMLWPLFDVSAADYMEYIKQIAYSVRSMRHVNQALWFIPCLFAVEMMYYFISKMKKPLIVIVTVVLVCLGWVLESGVLSFDNDLLPWNLDSGFFALGFYAFGNMFSHSIVTAIRKAQQWKYKGWICVGIALLCFTVLLPLALYNGKITLGSKILHNGFILYATGIIGTIMILALSVVLGNNKFLKFCGSNSYTIMATHYVTKKYMVPQIYHLLGMELYNRKILSETIIPFLFVFLWSLMFTLVFNAIKKKIQQHKNPFIS